MNDLLHFTTFFCILYWQKSLNTLDDSNTQVASHDDLTEVVCDNCDKCKRSRLEAESKCRGLHRWLSSNRHQVFFVVYWTFNTAFLPRVLWPIRFIEVKQPVFSTFYYVSASFLSLTLPTHPRLKVNKSLSNLSGSRSRLYIRCNTSLDTFFL